MLTTVRKATLGIALLTLTPMAAVLSGSGSEAQAHTYVSGGVTIGGPDFVLGFSYGNPYRVGHIHSYPTACSVGPLYYYPAYQVYGHYHPAYSYSYYAPRRVSYGHAYGGHWYGDHPARGCHLNHSRGRGYGHTIRGHRYGH